MRWEEWNVLCLLRYYLYNIPVVPSRVYAMLHSVYLPWSEDPCKLKNSHTEELRLKPNIIPLVQWETGSRIRCEYQNLQVLKSHSRPSVSMVLYPWIWPTMGHIVLCVFTEKDLHISGPQQFKPVLNVQGSTVYPLSVDSAALLVFSKSLQTFLNLWRGYIPINPL